METLSTNTRQTIKYIKHSRTTHINNKYKSSKHKNKKLMLTLIQLIYEIRESRNKLKYEKVNLNQSTIVNKINSKIAIILNTHFKVRKINDTVQQFQNSFCINNALAKIENTKLKILTKSMN